MSARQVKDVAEEGGEVHIETEQQHREGGSHPETLMPTHGEPPQQHQTPTHGHGGLTSPPPSGYSTAEAAWYGSGPPVCGPTYGSFYEGPAYPTPPVNPSDHQSRPPSSTAGLPPAPPTTATSSTAPSPLPVNGTHHHDTVSSLPWANLHRDHSRKVTSMPSNANLRKEDLVMYEDLINFPRAKDKESVRCVMCGNPPSESTIIPRQNKDVCKDCDKSTWQHVQSRVYFKWCKGCKKFINLGMFAEKLDAAKCDRCRERGRQSYLARKGKEDRNGLDLPSQNPILRAQLEEQHHHQIHHPPLESPGRHRPLPMIVHAAAQLEEEEAGQAVPPVSAHPGPPMPVPTNWLHSS